MEIKTWSKIGETKVLAEDHHKALLREWFLDPHENKPIDFSLFGSTKSARPTIVFPLTVHIEVVAVRQFRPAANQIVLELPGGEPHSEATDNSASAVGRRELMEETGYGPGKMIELAPLAYFDPGFTAIHYYPFLALNCCKMRKQKLDPGEYIEVVIMPFQEWLRMIFQGVIIDNKSMAVTLMALPHILNAYPEVYSRQLFTA